MTCRYFLFWEQIQKQLLTGLFCLLLTNMVPQIWARERAARCKTCRCCTVLHVDYWTLNYQLQRTAHNKVHFQGDCNRKSNLYQCWADLGSFSQFALLHSHLQLICLFIVHWASSIPVFCGHLYVGPPWAMCYISKLRPFQYVGQCVSLQNSTANSLPM